MARVGRLLGGLALVVLLLPTLAASPAVAQDPTATSTTATVEVPSRDIVPKANSGAAPTDAGDRGGALQLGLLALVVLVIAGAVTGLVRQSRRARQPGSG